MTIKKHARQIFVITASILVSCTLLSYPMQPASTQATEPPQIYLPLVSTPDICTPTLFRPLPPTLTTESTPEPSEYPSEIFAAPTGSTFYVTINGSPNGNGSLTQPWDLDSALLNRSQRIKPGDTVLVRGGTYLPQIEPRKFNIKLYGGERSPITVRAYPGERVIIDGGIEIYDPNLVFWGFEITNSDTDRVAEQSGSSPDDLTRAGGVGIYAANVKLINNVIHDGRGGISAFDDAVNAVIYGNISYNNGWKGPDRGHGHGLYAQNQTGTKIIAENIIFNNFGAYSVHIYRENGPLYNFDLIGNITFNNTFLVGGSQPANNINVYENYVYNTTARFGYGSTSNGQISIVGNRFWNLDSTSLVVKWWNQVTLKNNCIFNNHSTAVDLQYPNQYSPYDWNSNAYLVNSGTPFRIDDSSHNWTAWRHLTGFDSNGTLERSQPTKTEVFVRPNFYEPKRGNIIIYNWVKANTVQVDISALGLAMGDQYTLHNAQNFYQNPISGTFEGKPLDIPMTGWTVAKPVGWNEPLGDNTFPTFGVFVLVTK